MEQTAIYECPNCGAGLTFDAAKQLFACEFCLSEFTRDEVLAANPDKVEQYKGGKTGLIGFFVGQCMKAMKGQGNPKLINEMLAKKLS